MARWMVRVQDFCFTAQFARGSSDVVPTAPSTDLIEKTSCWRRFEPIEHPKKEDWGGETVGNIAAVGAIGRGPTVDKFRAIQQEAFGDRLNG